MSEQEDKRESVCRALGPMVIALLKDAYDQGAKPNRERVLGLLLFQLEQVRSQLESEREDSRSIIRKLNSERDELRLAFGCTEDEETIDGARRVMSRVVQERDNALAMWSEIEKAMGYAGSGGPVMHAQELVRERDKLVSERSRLRRQVESLEKTIVSFEEQAAKARKELEESRSRKEPSP